MFRPHTFLAYANFSLKEDPESFRRILATITEDLKDPMIQMPAKLERVAFENPEMELSESEKAFVEAGTEFPEMDRTPRTILEGIAGLIIENVSQGRDLRAAEIKLGRDRMLLTSCGEAQAWGVGMADIDGRFPFRVPGFEELALVNPFREIAFNAAFGYRNSFCRDVDGISRCKMRTALFDEGWCTGENRPLCYECYQEYFRRALALVVQGKPFEEIPGFMDFLNSSTRRQWQSLDPHSLLFSDAVDRELPYKSLFNDYLWRLVSASFMDFVTEAGKKARMEKLDFRNLKQCRQCENFFIAEDKKAQDCSTECKRKAGLDRVDKIRPPKKEKTLEKRFSEKNS